MIVNITQFFLSLLRAAERDYRQAWNQARSDRSMQGYRKALKNKFRKVDADSKRFCQKLVMKDIPCQNISENEDEYCLNGSFITRLKIREPGWKQQTVTTQIEFCFVYMTSVHLNNYSARNSFQL